MTGSITMGNDVQNSRFILGMRVDCTTYVKASEIITDLSQKEGSSYVCIGNVHMVMEAYDSLMFKEIVNRAELVTPDGMPIVFGLKILGLKSAERVCGPELTLHICEKAEKLGIKVGFYGGTKETLLKVSNVLKAKFPLLKIFYTYSPPFRELKEEESKIIIRDIIESGVNILFVGIGCPKQEIWMARHKDKTSSVMIGVGAAFDFIAGNKSRAPYFLQRIGLEWFFRLISEPKRLWKRYLYNNPRFIFKFGRQVLVQIFKNHTL